MLRLRGPCVRWRVARRSGASGRARSAVRTTLAGWGWDGDGVSAVVLVVSEMLTNAQVHTDGEVRLVLRRTRRGVRLSVTDTDPGCRRGATPAPNTRAASACTSSTRSPPAGASGHTGPARPSGPTSTHPAPTGTGARGRRVPGRGPPRPERPFARYAARAWRRPAEGPDRGDRRSGCRGGSTRSVGRRAAGRRRRGGACGGQGGCRAHVHA